MNRMLRYDPNVAKVKFSICFQPIESYGTHRGTHKHKKQQNRKSAFVVPLTRT